MNKEEIDKNVKEYLKKVPCSLVLKDGGKIEICYEGLEDISHDKIKFVHEYDFEHINSENIENFYIYNGKIFSAEIDFLTEYNLYKLMQNYFGKYSGNIEEKKMEIIIYKLMSINIEQKDLKFKKDYLDKFKKVADEDISNEEKVKELKKIFQNIGLCIPKKIFVGGLYINNAATKILNNSSDHFNEFSYGEDIQFAGYEKNSSSYYNKSFNIISKDKTKTIIGGDFTKDDINEWKKSIDLKNSAIIEYTNIIDARELLDEELKKKLKIPFQMLIDKRKNLKIYLDQIKNNNLKNLSGYKNLTIGFCEEEIKKYDFPEIHKQSFKIRTPAAYIGYYTKELKKTFDDLIVGVNIKDIRNDDYNGQWTFKFNPLLNKEINITFVSCFDRAQRYDVEIYLMKQLALY